MMLQLFLYRFPLVLAGVMVWVYAGEGMERLWSYLRRFARLSKEMRPSHHIDVLSGALVYYGIWNSKEGKNG